MWDLIAPHFYQHLTLSDFLNLANLENVQWHLTVALIFIPFYINEGEHIFTLIPSLVKNLGPSLMFSTEFSYFM